MGAAGAEADAGDGTDFAAIKMNHVSITPLKIDLTDYNVTENISIWTAGLISCHK